MAILNFSAVLRLVRDHCYSECCFSQFDTLDCLFDDFFTSPAGRGVNMDKSLVSRIFGGQRRLPKVLITHYATKENTSKLEKNLELFFYCSIRAPEILALQLYTLVQEDKMIEAEDRAWLCSNYPCVGMEQQIPFMARVIAFSLPRLPNRGTRSQ